MENWKRYKDTDYEVSDKGRVRNIKTKKIKAQHKKYNGRYDNDYLKVSLSIGGRTKMCQFIGWLPSVLLKILKNQWKSIIKTISGTIIE